VPPLLYAIKKRIEEGIKEKKYRINGKKCNELFNEC
jgi:hypothetical protein